MVVTSKPVAVHVGVTSQEAMVEPLSRSTKRPV
jgi:hypothetical protein